MPHKRASVMATHIKRALMMATHATKASGMIVSAGALVEKDLQVNY